MPLSTIPKYVQQAVLAVEDQGFGRKGDRIAVLAVELLALAVIVRVDVLGFQ